MNQQCDRCGGWFGLTAWTCSACQQLAHYLRMATLEVGKA